jgi:hypothetical protein
MPCSTRSPTGELDQARRLARSLRAGMADRNNAAADLIGVLAATGADLLIRCKSGRRLPIIGRCRDGSWLSSIGATRVRPRHPVRSRRRRGRRLVRPVRSP